MPMSPKLLRPRQTIHPEAAAWASRVRANGSSVSGTTLVAVSKFCRAIDSAGIRSRFYRLNLFCGGAGSSDTTRLNACLVPLYRGPSLGGTQYGGTTDTNNGSFSSGDYREDAIGGPGGLKGTGSRWLDTGLAGNTFSAGDRHCSVYWTENATLTGNRVFIGNSDAASSAAWFDIHSRAPSVGSDAQITPNYSLTHTAANKWQLAQYVGTDSAESYSDGADKKTRTTFPLGSPTASTTNWFVFGINPSLFSGVRTDARIAFYSIGLSIPENKILPFYEAVQAFQSALGRSV